jgi:branched-chain amino acid transport system permease protein
MFGIIIVSIAIITILQTSVNVSVGTEVRVIPSFAPGMLKAGMFSISAEKLLVIFISVLLVTILMLFINKTKPGQQMLAVAQSPEGAALQGIKIHRISAIATVTSCSLAALVGSLMGSLLHLHPFMGDYMLIKSAQLVILGGIGSIGGVLVGGLIIGTIDAVIPLFASGSVSQAIGLGIIIVLLLIRPQGLFGHEM